MITSYYKLPLEVSKIVKNNDLQKCDIKQSIVHFVHLITTSYFGECTFDESFGCSIWNVDFDNLTSTNRLRNIIAESLEESIEKHEKRLDKVSIRIDIKQEELKSTFNRIKKRVDIRVKGVIKQTNEPFQSLEKFYIAPLSY
ncbi:GPW/gp25 family protein [Sungkyunkwania multivorans]|uniref:GPW/gp25 family protein n=1 Tax=Sungkyunkwania multivorans TaxID=1173618 RepID=A0ABW3D1Z3_9FLAO